MATLTASERIDLVEEAREHLNEAIRCLKRAFPGDGYVQAYIIDHLRIQAGSGHGFLSNDPNMDDLIESPARWKLMMRPRTTRTSGTPRLAVGRSATTGGITIIGIRPARQRRSWLNS